MIQAEIQREVISVLRRVAMSGSDREIGNADPLGEFGLGLDSLALLDFILALERHFDIEIPENIWVDRGQLSLKDLVDIIAEAIGDRETAPPAQKYRPAPASTAAPADSKWGKLTAAVRHRGLFQAFSWAAGKAFTRLAHLVYQKDRFYILSFDFRTQTIPAIPVPKGAKFAEVTPDDLPAAEGLWLRAVAKEKHRLFGDRLRDGFAGYATWMNGKIVGLCWVTESGDHEPDTGLQIRLRENSCYGLDLNEHPDYRGQGIGLATVAYSLHKSQERGRRFLYSVVHASNERMLGASIQLLGYRKIGEIVTTRLLRRPSSVCFIGDEIVDSKTLVL